MTYVSLYRKWRPRVFSDVVGQKHVVRTLTNALDLKRISHAYLFSGPRGTGKTTLARLLAKGLNCVDGPTGSPCGHCDRCVRIAEGTSVDVLEIDGASNRGIDEIREIRERVKYAPAEGEYKVYIIDEVHMLTPEAFNALLKVLEEPPRHVVFVFATTEQHKIPATIVSRCQNFDFKSLPAADILERLAEVARGEKVQPDEAALALMVRHAEGGLRDAIGFLDQAISFSDGDINEELVAEVLGVVKSETLETLAEAIADGDLKRCLMLVKENVDLGHDIRQWTSDAARYFRDLMLLALLPDGESDMFSLTPEARERAVSLARRLGADRLVDIVERLGLAESDMRDAPSAELVLQLALVDLVQGRGETDVTALTKRLAALEKQLSSMKVGTTEAVSTAPPTSTMTRTVTSAPTPATASGGKPFYKEEPSRTEKGGESPPRPAVDGSKPSPPDAGDLAASSSRTMARGDAELLDQVRDVWPDLLQALRERKAMQQVAFLQEGVPGAVDGTVIEVYFSPNHQFHKANIEAEQNRKIVETVLSQILEKNVTIRPLTGTPPEITVSTPGREATRSEEDSGRGDEGDNGASSHARSSSSPDAREKAAKSNEAKDRDEASANNEKSGEPSSTDKLMAEALKEPIVKAALDLFGGTITKIERKDDDAQ